MTENNREGTVSNENEERLRDAQRALGEVRRNMGDIKSRIRDIQAEMRDADSSKSVLECSRRGIELIRMEQKCLVLEKKEAELARTVALMLGQNPMDENKEELSQEIERAKRHDSGVTFVESPRRLQ